MEVAPGMFFLTFSNADVQFAKKDFIWRTYTIKEALLIIYRLKLINQKEFAKTALNENIEAFIVYVSFYGS